MNCTAQKLLDLKEVTYEANTRGKNMELKITADSIIYKDNHKIKKLKTTSDTWKEITKIASKIDMHSIANFNPPSEKRISDKALHATLKVDVNDGLYVSQVFDHGNPPKELKRLIDLLFKVAEFK